MVRQTHRRRQSRGRRRNTRRSRRTQRGGGMFSFLGFGSSDLDELRNKANTETDPIKKAEIQKDITCAEAEEKLEQVKKTIKEKGSTGAATGGVDSPSQLSSTGTSNGMGTSNSNMFRGGRRKSRRYRRK